MNADQVISEALGVILGRGFRTGLYRELTADVAEGLNESTYPVISALARAGTAATAAALATELGLDRSVVSRRAADLTAAGLLRTTANPADRRQVLLTLTDTGSAAVTTMRARLQAAIGRHLSDWAAEDRDRFAIALRRFAASPLQTGQSMPAEEITEA